MGGFTAKLQAAETWPINAKKAVTNWKPFGDSQIETYYHNALEDGRELQKSITDANNWLMEEKKHALQHIQQLFNHVKLGTDGKLDNPWRAIKYGYDIINFMQQVSKFGCGMKDDNGKKLNPFQFQMLSENRLGMAGRSGIPQLQMSWRRLATALRFC